MPYQEGLLQVAWPNTYHILISNIYVYIAILLLSSLLAISFSLAFLFYGTHINRIIYSSIYPLCRFVVIQPYEKTWLNFEADDCMT